MVPIGDIRLVRGIEIVGVFTGLLAVGAIVFGSGLLLKETRIAVRVLTDRITAVKAQALRR